MARTYLGKVVSPTKGTSTSTTVSVEIEGTRSPRAGTSVELRVLLTDEEIGRRLREMLTVRITKRSVRDFATEIEDALGWPALAELVRDVIAEGDDA